MGKAKIKSSGLKSSGLKSSELKSSELVVNLAVLMKKPTGITLYAQNIYPYLQPLQPLLLIAQAQLGFDCHIIPDNMTPNQGSKGHLRRLLWTQFALPQLYHQFKANLLFSPLPEAPLFAHCRQIVMVHDLIPWRFPKRFSPLTPYFRAYIPQVLQQSEHIICNSLATAQDITQFWGIPASKITSIPLAYDPLHFRVLAEARRSDLPPYFLYLGRPDPHKNLTRLLQAFAQMKTQDCQLWIAGPQDNRYTPLLQQQAQELGIGDRLVFLDYLPLAEVPRLINQALALVFPSLWEGFGFPVLEAMACGTPVITSNLSSLPEVVGEAGILIDPYNLDELAAAMDEVARDVGLRSQLRQLGLSRASQFSWEKTGEATREVLRSFL